MKKRAEELIRELVPELQYLKEGCIISAKTTEFDSDNVEILRLLIGGYLVLVDNSDVFCLPRSKAIKSRGCEINVGHVVLACGRRWKSSTAYAFELSFYDEVMSFKKRGKAGSWEERRDVNIDVRYDILKPFYSQSEEFYEFIVKILE